MTVLPKTTMRRPEHRSARRRFLRRAAAFGVGLIATAVLQQTALETRAGGVGFYPDRHFVHLDVGPVRQWTIAA